MVSKIDALYALGGLGSGGERKLVNQTFEQEILERLLIGPGTLPDDIVTVEHCRFVRCKVRGEFRVAPAVRMQNVVFEDMVSPDLMTINTQAALDQVVVKGGKGSKGLWVKPAEIDGQALSHTYANWVRDISNCVEWMLDFSDYEGNEIEVVGLPLEKIKWNKEKNVVLRREWSMTEGWRELNFPITGFFRSRMRRLQSFDVSEGVFSLPARDSKRFAQAMNEIDQMISSGFSVCD